MQSELEWLNNKALKTDLTCIPCLLKFLFKLKVMFLNDDCPQFDKIRNLSEQIHLSFMLQQTCKGFVLADQQWEVLVFGKARIKLLHALQSWSKLWTTQNAH